MIKTITNWFMTTLSLLTAFGVFMHDGHLDKAVVSSLDVPVDAAHVVKGGHTHADYNASDFLMNKSFAYQAPAIAPRNRSERRHRLKLPQGLRHAFDDALMPILT